MPSTGFPAAQHASNKRRSASAPTGGVDVVGQRAHESVRDGGSAGDDQPVEQINKRLHGCVLLNHGHDEGQSACALYGLHVGQPQPLLVAVVGRCDADACHCGVSINVRSNKVK